MEQIICKDVSLGYNSKPIIEHLNFSVEQGAYFCIVGENGAGKSTLMKTILGLIQPLYGNFVYEDGLFKEIGYLPQQTQIQRDFPASVWEIVLSGCQSNCGLSPFYSKKQKQIAKDAIKKMNISQLEKRCYRELSGGQQQRVLLARALCSTRKILLLDEPVSGLDPKATNEMYKVIKQLNDDGITIIMISHDILVALNDATHILHLGKKTFFGTKQEYLQSDIGHNFSQNFGGSDT